MAFLISAMIVGACFAMGERVSIGSFEPVSTGVQQSLGDVVIGVDLRETAEVFLFLSACSGNDTVLSSCPAYEAGELPYCAEGMPLFILRAYVSQTSVFVLESWQARRLPYAVSDASPYWQRITYPRASGSVNRTVDGGGRTHVLDAAGNGAFVSFRIDATSAFPALAATKGVMCDPWTVVAAAWANTASSLSSLTPPSFTPPNFISLLEASSYGVYLNVSVSRTIHTDDVGATSAFSTDFLPEVALDIAAGYELGCVVLTGGKLVCWGADGGEAGYPESVGEISEVLGDDEDVGETWGAVDIGNGVVEVEMGIHHTCVLLVRGAMRCFGEGANGRLGYGSTFDVGDNETPNNVGDVNVGEEVVQMALGIQHTCVLTVFRRVLCWGGNGRGQLGRGDTTTVGADDLPSQAGKFVDLGGEVRAIAAGSYHTCAIMANDSSVRCWGECGNGQCGMAQTDDIGDDESPLAYSVVQLGQNKSAGAIAAGGNRVCVALNDADDVHGGEVVCFGEDGAAGMLGRGTTSTDVGDDEHPSSAGSLPVGGSLDAMALGAEHTCFLIEMHLRCFGEGDNGRLGYGSTSDVTAILENGIVQVGDKVTKVAAGSKHTCTILHSGGVLCFGSGGEGALGNADTDDIGDDETPASTHDGITVPLHPIYPHSLMITRHPATLSERSRPFIHSNGGMSIVGESGLYALLTDDGRVRTWGDYDDGSLGYGNALEVGSEIAPNTQHFIDIPEPVTKVALGNRFGCAITVLINVYCWGINYGTNLGITGGDDVGDDDPISAYGPLDFGDTDNANLTDIACGYQHCLALFDNGKVKSWGDALRGAPGYGTTTDNRASNVGFVDEGGGFIVGIAGGSHISAVIYANGTVKIWGQSSSGLLANPKIKENIGNDELPNTIPPVDLGGEVESLEFGGQFGCALFKNGSGKVWGVIGGGTNGFGCFYPFNTDDFNIEDYDDPYFDQFSENDENCDYRVGDDEQVIASRFVELDEKITHFKCGDFPAAVTESGAVYTWGGWEAEVYMLGNGELGVVSSPRDHGPIIESGGLDLAVSDTSGCVILDSTSMVEGNIYCWGTGGSGLQGTGTTSTHRLPTRVTDTVLGTDVLQRAQSPAQVFLELNSAASSGVIGGIVAPESHVVDVRLDAVVLSNVGPTFPEAIYVDSSASLNFGSDIVDPSQCPFDGVTAIGDSKACFSPNPASNDLHLARGRLGAEVWNASTPDATLATTGGSELEVFGDFSFASVYGIVQVFVGGRECTSPTISSSFTTLTCFAPIGVGANQSVALSESDEVVGAPDAIFAVIRDSNLTISYSPPVVDVVVPDTDLDPLGGEAIRIQGSGFGSPSLSSYAVDVSIDGVECTDVIVESDAEIRCTTPAGFGRTRHLVVTVEGQSNAADGVTVATLAPEITSITPEYALAGGVNDLLTFVINGTGFGVVVSDFSNVTVGGLACEVTTIISPATSFSCQLNASGGWVEDWDRIVQVSAGGQKSSKTRGLFEGVEPLSLSSTVIDGSNPTTGGGIVRLIGNGFGFAEEDIAGIWLEEEDGGVVSVEYSWSEAELRVEMPAGIGTDLVLTVQSAVGVEATSLGVSYDAPTITTITPSYGLAGSVLRGGFIVNGTGFGASEDDVIQIKLGGVTCASWTVLSVGEAVQCDEIDVTNGWSSTDAARIWVRGSQDSGVVRGAFQGLSAPSISAIATIQSLDTSGGGKIVLAADGLGRSADDLFGVYVGSTLLDVDSGAVEWGELQMTVTIPNGVGVQPIWFVNSNGATSSKLDTISYASPTLTTLTPSYALQGPTAQEITLCGENFPPSLSLSENTTASLGGVECFNTSFLNASCILCNISTTSSWPSPTTVKVIVSGVSSGEVSGVFEGIDAPVLSEVDLDVLDVGDELTLIGSNFGNSVADISSIPLGSSTCDSIEYVSASVLRCTIASTHPDFTSSSTSETAALSVCNTAGACSSSSIILPISGRGDIPTPVAPPWSLDVYREIAAAGELVVSWVYYSVDDEEEIVNNYNNATSVIAYTTASSFYIEAYRADQISSLSSSSSSSPSSSATVSVSGSALTSSTVASRTFSTTISVFSRIPYYVRVYSVGADGGMSNASSLAGPIAEACVATEFLPTHKSVESWLCEECDSDRVICAGLHAENVTALQGWWRIPWVQDAPSFGYASCDVAAACLGWDDAIPSTTRSQNGTQGVAVPGLSLHPSEYEKCRDGHEGVLCAQCSKDYYEEVTGDCIACGDLAVSYVRFLGIAIVILILFSGFLLRSVFSASSGSRPEVILAKILSSHLQSITIVAAANIDWSIPARNFFNVVDAGTSFSSQGISLECIMGAAGKNPVILSSLTIYVLPTVLLLYAALFWFAMPYAYRACCATLVRIEALRSTGQYVRHIKISAVVLAFLLHATITKSAFAILTCRLIGPEGSTNTSDFQSRLVANLDIRCDAQSTIAATYGIAIPALILISLGIPLCFIAFVCRNRQRVETTAFRDVWAFAVAGYKPEFAWWEGIVQLRKFGLVAVTVWLSTSSAILQLTSAIAVITVALVLHTSIRPYHEEDHHYLELGALMTAFLTMLCGLYHSAAPDASSGSRLFITIIVITSNVGLVLAGIILVSLRLYRSSTRSDKLSTTASRDVTDETPTFSMANPQKVSQHRSPTTPPIYTPHQRLSPAIQPVASRRTLENAPTPVPSPAASPTPSHAEPTSPAVVIVDGDGDGDGEGGGEK